MSITNNNDFSQLKAILPIEHLITEWLPNGKRHGQEWVSLNPTRNDRKPGSFSVNLSTGVWNEFASGFETGGDIIELYCYLFKVGKSEALLDLNRRYGNESTKSVRKKTILLDVSDDKGELVYPAPLECGKPEVRNDGIWCYKDIAGNVLQYVVRVNDKKGGKKTLPYTYRNKNGVYSWECKGAGEIKKPLYGLEFLAGSDKDILLVEGEKTTEAARILLPEYIAMSWLGGAAAVHKVDFSPLHGRIVYLWPDNDEAGFKAMATIKELLRGIAENVVLIDIKPMGELFNGWDLADSNPEQIDKIRACFKPKLDRQSFPDLSLKFNPLNTTDNVAYLLNHFNVKVKYNMMTNYPEFHLEGKKFSSVNAVDCYFTEICNLCVKNGVPKVDLASHLVVISDANRFHPVRDFIESKSWDGIPRVSDFINTVTAENQKLAGILIYRWMLGCVAAAYSEEGISLEGMLIFQGKQKIGKTRWFTKLVPQEWRHLIQEAVVIDPDNKDLVIEGTSIWIGELGEINGIIRKSDIESLKNFITRSNDVYRVPFGKRSRKVPRRTAFFGSVNNETFLADETGNRRYWTVGITEINYEHDFDMQQVWAQIKYHLDRGESYRLTDEEQDLVNAENELFKSVDPMEELILQRFTWDLFGRDNPLTASQVLLKLGFDITDNNRIKLARECGSILTKLTGKKARKSNKKCVFDMPAFIPIIYGEGA